MCIRDSVYNVLRCVPAFHPNVLAELLGDKFKLSSVVFSPTDLGIPSERRRRYTTAECVDLVSAWQPFCLQHFGRLAFRRLVVDGNIYFVSPQRRWRQQGCKLAGRIPTLTRSRGGLRYQAAT